MSMSDVTIAFLRTTRGKVACEQLETRNRAGNAGRLFAGIELRGAGGGRDRPSG